MLTQGWICPVCGAGVSPFVEVCPNCKKYYYTYPDIYTPPTPWKPIITCGGTTGNTVCNVHATNTDTLKVNLGDMTGYLQGQNPEELNKLPIVTFPTNPIATCSAASSAFNQRTVALIHEAREEARRIVNSLPENLREQFTLKISQHG